MIHLAAFMFTPGGHLSGWRHPEADPETDVVFQSYVDMAQMAERAKLDAIFFADTVAVPNNHAPSVMDSGKSTMARMSYLEPASLITALAPVTKDIGLIATITTTYNEPYHVARRMASLDHISNGRAGWNLVTSQVEEEAWNFGLDRHVEHSLRYDRALEFSDVVKKLWDSWEEDALVRDKDTGQIFDPAKVHVIDHKGTHFKVRGPLNVPRPPQGHPIIAEAGSSEPGVELAARTADIVFTAQQTLEQGRAFYKDVKTRATRYGRDETSVLIMPGIVPVVAPTDEKAEKLLAEIDGLMSIEDSLAFIQRFAGDLDLSQFPLDGPLPELPQVNHAKARQQLLIDLAHRENLTLGQLAKRFAGPIGHRIVCGSPTSIADDLEAWVDAKAADGFILIFPFFPGPLSDFMEMVVPELQRRGVFRTEYSGSSLRENLGLAKPHNQYSQRPNQTQTEKQPVDSWSSARVV